MFSTAIQSSCALHVSRLFKTPEGKAQKASKADAYLLYARV
jgi:hypothetical protein